MPQKIAVERRCVQIMSNEAMKRFGDELTRKVGNTFTLKWDVDRKGVVCGWCTLKAPEDICAVAEVVAGFKGRVMTISPLNTPSDFAAPETGVEQASGEPMHVVVNYHFYFERVNLTATITLPDQNRTVKSITPILVSADWHEREMQELYNIRLQGHPNSKRLFLDPGIHMTDHTMIPLSEALNGASTNTLWEKIMKSGAKGGENGEQL